jgi:hypothetical protein
MQGERATVVTTTRPLWAIRLRQDLPRYLMWAVAIAGLAASARFAIAPPSPVAGASMSRTVARPDKAAESYAALFARAYLTWNSADPLASQRALQPFVGQGIEPAVGLQLPSNGEQRTEWVEVVQERMPVRGERVYTIAAQTDTGGLLYLTVSVLREPDGHLALASYPSIVGPPSSGPGRAVRRLREVEDPALVTVVERALRNYLAASSGELSADLTTAAHISVPGQPLTMVSAQRLGWTPDARSVIAVVQARDSRGVQYTLAYEVDVVVVGGRWEVSAVQMDPSA